MTDRQETPGHEYPVLILGGGRGGSAMLEMFLDDCTAQVIGLADTSPSAPGIVLAESVGIPTFTDIHAAMQASLGEPRCIIYNLTGDDAAVALAPGDERRVVTGAEARLLWQMVTNVKRLKSELERSQNHLQAIIRHVLDGIITVDAAGIVHGFNPAAEKLFGVSAQEAIGTPFMQRCINVEAGEDAHRLQHSLDGTEPVAQSTLELSGLRADAGKFPLEVSISGMTIGNAQFFTLIARDITERRKAEEKLAYLAHHDFLTGLPNRALFLDRLTCVLTLAQRSGQALAVLFLDLDGFKAVNDTQGHEMGDRLLQEVARRLQAVARTSDTVARLGGDEFTLLLNNVGNMSNAEAVAEKVIRALAAPCVFDEGVCRVGASIGIALFEGGEVRAETLLKQADSAMYGAKEAGKNCWRVYSGGALTD